MPARQPSRHCADYTHSVRQAQLHSLRKMVAKIGAPAPTWKAQAVVGGEIKEISLDDYKVGRGPDVKSSIMWCGWCGWQNRGLASAAMAP